MGDTVFFKNAKLSFRVGTGGDHFVSDGTYSHTNLINLLTKLGLKGIREVRRGFQKSPAVIYCDILGIPLTPMDIFSGNGFVSFTFYKLVKQLLMIDDSLACSWHYSDNPLTLCSDTSVSYGDVILLKKKDGDYIRLRVSNHHFINLDYPEQKQGVFEYLGIKTPMAFGRDTYGYRPLNEGTGNFPFPHYKKNDWVAATKMAIALVTSARDKMKNTGEVQVKFPTSKLGNPCGEIPLRLQDEIEVKPMSPPTGKLDYLDFTYNYNAKTLRSRLRLTYTPHWTIGNYYPQNTTLTRPRVTSKPYSVPIDSDTIIDTKRREAFTMKLRKNRKTTIR
jgi:hypothetical protein